MTSLIAGGTVLLVVAVAAYASELTSPAFGAGNAALVLLACDLFVAALIIDTRRISSLRDWRISLQSLLSGGIADGVMTFAVSSAAVIALFGNSKPVERLGYLLAIFVLVPLCVTLTWRRQLQGCSAEHQRLLALATLTLTVVALALARLLTPLTVSSIGTSLFLLFELVAARGVLARYVPTIPRIWAHRISARTALAVTPLLLTLGAVSFVPTETLTFVNAAVALSASLAAFGLAYVFGARHLPRGVAHIFDVGVLVIASLVVFYLGPPTVENQNNFLGPVLDVLHGHPMLVSTFSQYGVAVIDALAPIFLVVRIGYGTFTLLLAGTTVTFFAVVYATLRCSTRSVLVAATGLITIVVLDVFGQIGSYTDYPSTGVLRFGLPWLIILCSVASARATRYRRAFDGLIIAVVAVAAVWSGETATYCLGTAGALACLQAAITCRSTADALRQSLRYFALLLTVSLSSLLLFTLVTLLTTHAWPDWLGYGEYIYAYTFGEFGDLPIDPWSPGLAIGGIYTLSAIALVLIVTTRAELVRAHQATFRALTGLTALGALVFTYFLGRSHPNNLIHISPPVLALLFVWFDLARTTLAGRVTVAVASAAIVGLAATVLTAESADIDRKYPNTALAAVLGATAPLDMRLRKLWDNPIVEPPAAHVVRFIRSIGVKRTSLTVLLAPAVETEVLLRLDTPSAVGSSNPAQEVISKRGPHRAAAAVRALRPGGLLVTSDREPLLPLEEYAYSMLVRRFVLHEIRSDGRGLRAYSMTLRH